MIWKSKCFDKRPHSGARRRKDHYAWFPVLMENYEWVWLEYYYTVDEYGFYIDPLLGEAHFGWSRVQSGVIFHS